LPYRLIRFLLTYSFNLGIRRPMNAGRKNDEIKSREYAKARRLMQPDVEMKVMTTTGGVNRLTPEARATDLARS